MSVLPFLLDPDVAGMLGAGKSHPIDNLSKANTAPTLL